MVRFVTGHRRRSQTSNENERPMTAESLPLYVALKPGRSAMARLQAAFEVEPASALLWLGEPSDKQFPALAAFAQERDCAVLIRDAVDSVVELGLDGIHLSRVQNVAQARAALGDDYIIGVRAEDRHAAMTAAEDGAHYVMFAPLDEGDQLETELLTWWQEMMEIPCIGNEGQPGDFVLKIV